MPRRRMLLLALLVPVLPALLSASPERRAPAVSPAALAALLQPRPEHPLADARGRVPLSVRLREGEDAAALGLLQVAPGVGARWVERGEMEGFLEEHRGRNAWASPPLKLQIDRSGAWTRSAAAHARGKLGKGVVVGVIDTGMDVTHPDLRTPDGKTRVAWMLDLASQPRGIHPGLEDSFGCTQSAQAPCAVLSSVEIEADTKAGDAPRDAVGHGTHVAAIAAGNGGKPGTYAGVAPEASLIVVRVTRSSGGQTVTDIDILNAVNFVFDRARAMGMPAVVNVSLGGDYGPHDGTSTLEAGLAGFVGPQHPGRAIVVAAGNSGGVLKASSGAEYGVHTEARALPGSTTRVVLTMPASGVSVRGGAFVWLTFQPGDEVSVGLERNGAVEIEPLAPGQQGAREARDDAPYMAIINGVVDDGSPLTSQTNGAVLVIDGSFRSDDRYSITLEGKGTAQLWVQGTGDAEFGSAVGGSLFLNPLKQGTVNVPATHPSLLAVGCSLNRLDWPSLAGQIQVEQVGSLSQPPADTICYFSGAGPNALGVPKPEITAPGGFVVSAMSRDAVPGKNPVSMFVAPSDRCEQPTQCYVADSQHAVASGTSMSAPQVAGAVALLLEQKPDLTQPEITALLQAGSRRFEGLVPFEFQASPGALDIDTSLELLAPSAPLLPTSPDPARSWLHLSAGFARPDGRWPVVGSLLLRGATGIIADDFEPASLRLEASPAQITVPLRKIAPGFWQFSVAAPPGSGGEQMSLRVTLGDTLLGEKRIPISPDIWATRGMPEARGGCTASAPR